MIDAQNQALLKLALIDGIGQRTIKKLLKSNPNPTSIFSKDTQVLIEKDAIPERIALLIEQSRFNHDLENQLELMEKHKVELLTLFDEAFPESLKVLPDAPVLFYYQGTKLQSQELNLAFVGSRKASFYGKKHTQRIINELAYLLPEAVIISGLAYGIDTIAHQTALNANLKTIAVLAGGLPSIYPKENYELSQKIIESGGALISEQPINTKPAAHFFPMRNRIISGLSQAVIIMEASEKSGALITLKYGLEQNKELFALPGPIDHLNYIGCNRAIQNSQAKLLMHAADILNEFSVDSQLQEVQQVKDFVEDSRIKTDDHTLTIDDIEKNIYQLITQNQSSADILADQLNMPIAKVLSILLQMELKGSIINNGEDYYSIL